MPERDDKASSTLPQIDQKRAKAIDHCCDMFDLFWNGMRFTHGQACITHVE